MKKIILVLVAFVLSLNASAQQETYISETGGVNNPVVYVDVNYPDSTPCGVNNESNAFENGKSFTHSLQRIVAHDFTVQAGEQLTLKSLLVNVFIGFEGSGVNASFVDVYYYSDNNGEPGGIIGSELSVFPGQQTVVGTNFGYDVWQVELDVADRVFHDQGSSPRTYWIGLSMEATDGSNIFWENSTLGLNGSGEAYDNGTAGYVVDPTLEGVYFITADCIPRLGVDDNFADRVQLFPNPVTDGILNITTPIAGEKQVIVYDVLGKAVIDTHIEGTQLNVSSLQAGVYLLQLTQNEVSVTKKIVIE